MHRLKSFKYYYISFYNKKQDTVEIHWIILQLSQFSMHLFFVEINVFIKKLYYNKYIQIVMHKFETTDLINNL